MSTADAPSPVREGVVAPSTRMMPFLIVSGDFVTTGGMDHANHALADYLARRGHEVHLVTHRAEAGLLRHSNAIVHRVPKPVDSYFLSGPLLDRVGRSWGRTSPGRVGGSWSTEPTARSTT